jgi:GH43 family beta-xylosidase
MSNILFLKNSINSYNEYPSSLIINSSNPIPIKNNNSLSNYYSSNNSFDNIYCFNLKIITNKNNYINEKQFSCYNTKKYANLIKTSHKIEFDNIKAFEVTLSYGDNSFSLKGDINNTLSSYIEKNDNLFIGFSQDSFGNTICSCYLLNKNINNLCISPPN